MGTLDCRRRIPAAGSRPVELLRQRPENSQHPENVTVTVMLSLTPPTWSACVAPTRGRERTFLAPQDSPTVTSMSMDRGDRIGHVGRFGISSHASRGPRLLSTT